MTQLNTQTSKPPIPQEQILVVKRNLLFPEGAWSGCKKVNMAEFITVIQNHKEFLPRPAMETDPTYKQIIPYLVFTHNDKYFLMQRKSKASEQRLKNKLTLGIGGHIRQEDLQNVQQSNETENILFNWALREFHEEVSYTGNLTIEPLCLINDDSNDVGKVHIGFVLLLRGDSEQISVKSELQNGYLATVEECKEQSASMESWSRMVFEFIKR